MSSFGANVVLASRNVKNLEGVGKKCLENGAKAVEVVAFDALKPESAEMLAKAASEAFNDGDDEKEDGDSNNNKSYCCDYAFLCAGASQSASAFDVTESAERVVQFERSVDDSSFEKHLAFDDCKESRSRVRDKLHGGDMSSSWSKFLRGFQSGVIKVR